MTSKQNGLSIPGLIILLILFAAFFGWLGYQPGMLLNEYSRALAFTLLGVALVIWLTNSLLGKRNKELLAYLDEQRKAQEEAQLAREIQLLKTQLTREVASGQAGIAARAIIEMDSRGWLTDGTLSNSHMVGADLHGAKLGWANFSGAFLSKINLQDADLSYANFSNASLNDAVMARANLDLAKLTEANLRGADLSLCLMNETDLSGAIVERAVLSGANMVEANLAKIKGEHVALNGANLERANLTESVLSYANLERANLSGANLSWANLSKANLEKVDFSESNLSGANLEDARLNGADLSGSFLLGARISPDTLSSARSLVNATMPDGSKYEEWVQNQSEAFSRPKRKSSREVISGSPAVPSNLPEESAETG